MKSVNVCKSIAVALGLLVISASARADIVSDFYNSMVNKSITWQEARASFESMDPTQQQAIREVRAIIDNLRCRGKCAGDDRMGGIEMGRNRL